MDTMKPMKTEDYIALSFFPALIILIIIGHICVYISRRLQSKRSKGITRIPLKPFNEKQLILYTGSEYSENKTPEAKILLSHPVCYANWGYAKLNKILKMRGIMTDDESDAVYHQEWDPTSKSMKTWKCNVCTGNVDDGVPPRYSSLSMV
ncbi:hypothetical protein CAEBREN_25497 [Caenorhabditis brenneri]|uniref:Uncharacterized protein n=1 Tax=Caenorhabditis brenneri TaxID=135651 RepID=G0MJN9_CAEBE|nr:hypothetical protein CAEBREN_25497 [Caenorhabditis brenneri]